MAVTNHNLVDDQLGAPLTDFDFSLTSGASLDPVTAGLTIDAVIDVDTTNVATWTAGFVGALGRTTSAEATASVTVITPTTTTATTSTTTTTTTQPASTITSTTAAPTTTAGGGVVPPTTTSAPIGTLPATGTSPRTAGYGVLALAGGALLRLLSRRHAGRQ